jgi:hypothetical protein
VGAVTREEENEAVKAVLIKSRQLIEHPDTWTKGHFCVLVTVEPETWRYCAKGAIGESSRELPCNLFDAQWGATVELAKAVPCFDRDRSFCGNIYDYNDAPTTTHADVLAWFDRAIANPSGDLL